MKKICIALLLVCCLWLVTGCGSGGGAAPSFDEDYGGDEVYKYNAMASDFRDEPDYSAYEAESGGYGSFGALPSELYVSEARKVVTSAEFYINTDDFAGAMRRLDQKIATSGSFIQQSDSSAATEYRAASASMTIRVPALTYGDFKTFLTDLAELVSSSEHGEDVTAQYYDTEARLKVLQAQEERVRTFISSAKNLEEIFTIERELTGIRSEIEQLTTVKNRLDNLTAYATVYVQISEIAEGRIVNSAGFGEKVNNALKGSLSGIVIAAQSLLLFVIWCWPLLVLLLIGFVVWRKFLKRRRSKLDQKDQTHS